MTPEQLAARDDGLCRSYGFQQGTDGYAQCRMRVDQQRRVALANAFYQAGQSLQQASAQQQAQMNAIIAAQQANRPINATTTCQRLGSTTTCTTNGF